MATSPRRGRPLKFKDAKTLQKKIDAYFADCDPHIAYRDAPVPYVETSKGRRLPTKFEIPDGYEVRPVPYLTEQKPYTVSGLALALDTNRETLNRYQKSDVFYDTVTRAKEKCHVFWEGVLNSRNADGAKFNLKNNWGYQDKVEVEHTDVPTGLEDKSDDELNAIIEAKRRERGAR